MIQSFCKSLSSNTPSISFLWALSLEGHCALSCFHRWEKRKHKKIKRPIWDDLASHPPNTWLPITRDTKGFHWQLSICEKNKGNRLLAPKDLTMFCEDGRFNQTLINWIQIGPDRESSLDPKVLSAVDPSLPTCSCYGKLTVVESGKALHKVLTDDSHPGWQKKLKFKGGGGGGRQCSNGKASPKKGPLKRPRNGERKTHLFQWTHNNNKKWQRHCSIMETKLLFWGWISCQLSSISYILYSQVREMAPPTSERVQLTSNEPFSSFLRNGIKSITFF